ncbi:unnamed protein product [Soboliphyme baturini]|uniref:Anaphase-promoting complex subunit 10 n=1 Tax=Soboliphyme baturini TaxID=241478 RepID=A0A183IGA9_9BILA|nr:unnamed protein product [Soboliphyme baturini]
MTVGRAWEIYIVWFGHDRCERIISGYGVEQLRDNNYETYWQSDGSQPHVVNIIFRQKTSVSYVALTFMLQIVIMQNYQNGRDTHVRQIKVYGPMPSNRFDPLLGLFGNESLLR